jgi:methylated-DNA-[protein]-cysteine S-methyltransferase
MITMLGFSLYRCDFGVGAVLSSEQGICEVITPFGGRSSAEVTAELVSRFPGAVPDAGYAKSGADELAAYFRGELQAFTTPLDLRHLSSFGAAVCQYVSSIPCGEVRSYGQVAAAIGSRGAARGVGAVMAANRLPIIIPCHRVVAADGSMRGYSAAGGVASKKRLLLLEGVDLG